MNIFGKILIYVGIVEIGLCILAGLLFALMRELDDIWELLPLGISVGMAALSVGALVL